MTYRPDIASGDRLDPVNALPVAIDDPAAACWTRPHRRLLPIPEDCRTALVSARALSPAHHDATGTRSYQIVTDRRTAA
jgi:hypothetical protein